MPERVLQFGQGNFLRAFADYFIDVMNEQAGFDGSICLVQSSASDSWKRFAKQDGLYTLLVRGQENGKAVDESRLITSVSRCINASDDPESFFECAQNPDLRFILSNTTEMGITYDPSCRLEDQPAASYPGKLTQFLYRRFRLGLPGFIVLPCELIDHNGQALEKCIHRYAQQWDLEEAFFTWLETENTFCSTLVDRIVPGYPKAQDKEIWEKLGYEDALMVTAEVYAIWVIEGPNSIREELPFEQCALPIHVVDDVMPYKQRKVRILNGAHTSFVPAAILSGFSIVRDCMKDEVIHSYLDKVLYEEVIPTLDLPREDLLSFAGAVAERFANPFIDHQLMSIMLNCTSKWRERCLPTVLAYAGRNGGEVSPCMAFSFAAYLAFYRAGSHGEYTIHDEEWVKGFFEEYREDDAKTLVHAAVINEKMWGSELMRLSGFEEQALKYLEQIETIGAYEVMKGLLG